MTMSDQEPRAIVRPFGLIGGKYEVDAAGARKYRLAWVIAGAVVALLIVRELIGVPLWPAMALAGIGLVVTLGLCVDVARKGHRL